jgi:hypothetical protein
VFTVRYGLDIYEKLSDFNIKVPSHNVNSGKAKDLAFI